jgi:hypothetical protein
LSLGYTNPSGDARECQQAFLTPLPRMSFIPILSNDVKKCQQSSSKNKEESRRCFKCGSKDYFVAQYSYNSDNDDDDDDKKSKKKDKKEKKEKKDKMTFKKKKKKGGSYVIT